ncbi:hypothetical protein I2F27_01050 [Acinetobacter sp. B5B]|uniref:hypothetical protein n=1 Tax=Acinetobacter baretiae TaxID=2605383 RepID=UPI0018C2F46B|nr:hypothetical protein [Acinetobacter baretiae]MBF7681926.1 hypothetical protein [Acinetobacter baretiae]MBF7685702.1 hypothetical protein [Acinetobacter baretiae]
MMKNCGRWLALAGTMLIQGCQMPLIHQKTNVLMTQSYQSFAMTPEQFRLAMNQKIESEKMSGLISLAPFLINNQFFSVANISNAQVTLEGKSNVDGQLTLVRYRSYLVDEKSLVIAMTLIKNTAKVLPPSVSEQDKEDWMEQVMEDAVASPEGFAEKEVHQGIIYSASISSTGLFEVSYRVLPSSCCKRI